MKSFLILLFFSQILFEFCDIAHGNYENFVCRRVDDVFETGNSPQITSKRVTQGLPGKRGARGEKGEKGRRGAIGQKGEIARVDAAMIQDLIDHAIESAQAQITYVTSRHSQEMKSMTQKWETALTDLDSKLAPTRIYHDIEGEVKITEKCEVDGCFSRIPQYKMSESEIVRIIDNSKECRQFVKIRCFGVLLFKFGNGWWVSRQGERMGYWGGATSGREKFCACGETGTCVDNRYKCNCDANIGDVMTQDEGYITDKAKLPVKELRFGDMGDPTETAWYTLGPLECWG